MKRHYNIEINRSEYLYHTVINYKRYKLNLSIFFRLFQVDYLSIINL